MPRFFVPPEAIRGQTFTLTGSEARHAAIVLRKNVGDIIHLFDGKDLSYQGRIESITADHVEGTILSQVKSERPIPIDLVLFQSLIKGPKWDWLVEKACEIGVTRLVPMVTARTVVKPSNPSAHERWKRIALAASKQCGRPEVMEVSVPLSFNESLSKTGENILSLIPWEKENKVTIKQACHNVVPSSPLLPAGGETKPQARPYFPSRLAGEGQVVATTGGEGTPSIHIFIGPEGGWENDEVERAKGHGAIPVRLGPTLLRSETAGLVAATLVLAECGVYA